MTLLSPWRINSFPRRTAKKLKRLLRDAIGLVRQHEELLEEKYAPLRARIVVRLGQLIDTAWENGEARRLVKRLRRHREDLFTFLDNPSVPFDNNHAERLIRPAVIMRKNSYSNRSASGADTQSILLSIFRMLKQRNHRPTETVTNALTTYLTTGQLLPCPPNIQPEMTKVLRPSFVARRFAHRIVDTIRMVVAQPVEKTRSVVILAICLLANSVSFVLWTHNRSTACKQWHATL